MGTFRDRGLRPYRIFILAAVVLVAAPFAATAAPRLCELPVQLNPPTIPPGARTTRISITATASTGADVQFRASDGTAGAPLIEGATTMSAEYTAPADGTPAAIVAAVGSNVCGFTIVRMDGTQISATPTRIPTLVVLEPPSARADRDVDVLVYVFALDEAYMPRRGNAPQFLPDSGSVAGVESLGPGAWRGRWRVPAGESNAVGIAATFGQDATATAALVRTAGPPASVEVVRDDEAAGGVVTGNPTAVLIRVRDAAGNLTDGTVDVEADSAQVGEPERVERGIYRASLTIPPGSRSDAVVIVARADRAVGTATLPIAPSAAAVVKITPPGPVRADGSNRAQIEVTVVDAYNNPVNEVPTATASRGDFGPPFAISPGQWSIPYRPPRISADTTEEVLVRVGGASAKVELELTAPR
jgi:hypothetical protein